jgi:nucleoside-diphosphate-sugar epimerase
MRFPGSDEAYNALFNVTDATLLAKGMTFVSLQEQAKGEIFNITNGDVFRWKQLWPKIGSYFGLEVDEPQTFSLATFMEDKQTIWEEIVQRYNLNITSLEKLVQWPFGDFLFNAKHDFFFDVSKLRRIGFNEMHKDSCTSFTDLFEKLKQHRIIPSQLKL